MIRKTIIFVLSLAASITMLAWISSYWLEFHWYHYDYQPLGTRWMYRSSDGGAWTTSEDGMMGDNSMSHVCLYLNGGTFEIHSQRQLQKQAKMMEHGFDWGVASFRYGTRRTLRRGGFHYFCQYGSTFAVPFFILSAYPTMMLVRGPQSRWRRRRKGLCLNCAYNLTGNTTGICSECGKPI